MTNKSEDDGNLIIIVYDMKGITVASFNNFERFDGHNYYSNIPPGLNIYQKIDSNTGAVLEVKKFLKIE